MEAATILETQVSAISWGSPPTPVLPRYVFDKHASVKLPKDRRPSRLPQAEKIGDLSNFWKTRVDPLDRTEERYFLELFDAFPPAPDMIVVPPGVEAKFLAYARLTIRTRSYLMLGHFANRLDGVRVSDLNRFPSLGTRPMLELMCLAEAGLAEMYRLVAFLAQSFDRISTPGATNEAMPVLNDNQPTTSERKGKSEQDANVWVSVDSALRAVLSMARDLEIAGNFADVLRPDLLEIADTIGYREALEKTPLSSLTLEQELPSRRVMMGLTDLCNFATEAERKVIELRLCGDRARTLDNVGRELGITRERVRQIQVRLERKIEQRARRNLKLLSELLVKSLPPVTSNHSLDSRISRLFGDDSTLAGRLALTQLKQALGYASVECYLLNDEAQQIVSKLRMEGPRIKDDVGLIDEEALASFLPNEQWKKFWGVLLECTGYRKLAGIPCLRDSAKARVKAALLKIGRPATKEEISAECGFDTLRVGGAISNIPSVVRADIHRWGLREWIDDEYEGITGEILQRIREGGGVASAASLMEELPQKFGVSPSSVRAYLGTAQFDVNEDEVREAKTPEFNLLPLEEIISGRDKNGHPFWNFLVDDRYFDGYSLSAVPYEVAAALGCQAGQSIRIPVRKPDGCRDLSVSWRIASSTKASIGYVSDPLIKLGASTGDTVSLVVGTDGLVELRLAEEFEGSNSATSILEKIKSRRRVL